MKQTLTPYPLSSNDVTNVYCHLETFLSNDAYPNWHVEVHQLPIRTKMLEGFELFVRWPIKGNKKHYKLDHTVRCSIGAMSNFNVDFRNV